MFFPQRSRLKWVVDLSPRLTTIFLLSKKLGSRLKWFFFRNRYWWFFWKVNKFPSCFCHDCKRCTRSTHHTSSGSSSMIMITMRLLIDQVHHLSNYCQDNYLESSVLFLPPIFWKTKATTNAALMKKVGDNGPITIPTSANGSLLVRQDPNSNVQCRSELFHWITPSPLLSDGSKLWGDNS